MDIGVKSTKEKREVNFGNGKIPGCLYEMVKKDNYNWSLHAKLTLS